MNKPGIRGGTFLEKVTLTFLGGGTKISRQLRNQAAKMLSLGIFQGGLFCEKGVCFSDNAPADVPDDIPEEIDLSEVPF